jgi:hypothetical protein
MSRRAKVAVLSVSPSLAPHKRPRHTPFPCGRKNVTLHRTVTLGRRFRDQMGQSAIRTRAPARTKDTGKLPEGFGVPR